MGAYHALQLALTRADLFPVALCQSGNYDPADWNAWGDRGEAAYFTNPSDYVAHLHGDHLDWLRQRLHVVLVVGEGPWETHPTGSLPSARHLGGLLAEKGIPHELDVWGHDSAHDWDWWQEADRAPPAAVLLTRPAGAGACRAPRTRPPCSSRAFVVQAPVGG